MKINIYLNDMNYRYEVYQIFNIYFISTDIKFQEPFNYEVYISEGSVACNGQGIKREYTFKEFLTKKENIRISIFLFLKELTGRSYPWGTLIGIRPSKIALKLMEDHSEDEIVEYLKLHNLAREDKSRLCIKVAKAERQYVKNNKKTISIYIGMPFCPTKCLYCSFASNSIEGYKKLVDSYIDALIHELDKTLEYALDNNLEIQCVYFGGGTPTSVSEEQFEKIMKRVYENFIDRFKVKEFTVECGRPDSITERKLETMKKYKVQRISINPQSMNEKTLKTIGRNHTAEDVKEKLNMARELGFDNINMDIILGLPFETLEDVKHTCSEIYKLKPENITIHGLALKRGSRLYEKIINNISYKETDQKDIIEMYNQTELLAESLNMHPYYMYRQKNMVGNMENTGYSIPGREGVYNIQMIEESQTIIACGADGVTKVVFPDENRLERFANLKDVKEYINRIDETIAKKTELLNTLFKKEVEE
ncbi:MAG: coproporphyrinogen III oxidase [Solirubrobacterales bacterium]